MLDRHSLNIIKIIAETGSMTDAAQRLHVTQSALSHSVKKLEEQLNIHLWHREGRHLVLTEAGRYALNVALRILPQFEAADRALHDMSTGERGQLRIGMECHPCYRWLLQKLPNFLEKWPKIDMDVKQKFQFGGIAALLNYEIDLLITPDPITHQALSFTPVFPYELTLVVAQHHRLAKHSYIEPGDIQDEVLYSYPVPIERLDIFSQFLLPANCLPSKHKTIETTDIMLQMVAAKRGVTALPNWLVKEYGKQFKLKSLKLGKKGIYKNICIAHRKNDTQIITQEFLDHLIAE